MKRITRDWSEYNAGLKLRGSLTFWLDEAVLDSWYNTTPTGKPGASDDYGDVSIITFATMKAVYGKAGRQTQGFLESLFELMGVE
jgi:hypothetical protein